MLFHYGSDKILVILHLNCHTTSKKTDIRMSWMSQYLPITDPTMIFFVVLCIILLAPIVMSKLRIPHIIGMVLAGIAIGKYGLGILERDSSFELFGKVGMLYIMFLAGLEMDASDITKRRSQFGLFGLLTFSIPFITGYTIGIWVLGYSDMASLILACILASNTLIAYPIVFRYGLQKHKSVALSVGSSMIALTMSLLILAAIVGENNGDTDFWFWIFFVLKVAVYCVVSVIFIPRLTRWFFRRYADGVLLYIYVLSVLFFSAALAEICGLEGIFGAFLTGLILNRFIPSVSPLMNRIEFIGNALFIPYFLIGVGMLIDIRILFHGLHTVWVVVCIVLAATLSKAVAAYASSLALKMPLIHGHMMFGMTEAHAAGAIAMTMVGMQLTDAAGMPLVDSDMLNGVIIMILFTSIISSIIVEQTSQRMLLTDEKLLKANEQAMSLDDEKIMIPFQHKEDVENLIYMANITMDKRITHGVMGINVVYDDHNLESNRNNGKKILSHAVEVAVATNINMQTQSRLATNIANGIKHAFKENDASEIIMAMHRPGNPGDDFWGAYAQGLTSSVYRQILICRIKFPLSTIRRIHVAVPSRVQFEPGFLRWVETLSRAAERISCRMVFHGREDTCELIREYIAEHHPDVRAEYQLMQHWKSVTKLAEVVNKDHLFVVITARPGTMSYKPAFDKLPQELTQSFPDCSLLIIYPDQHGTQDLMTFTAPTNA